MNLVHHLSQHTTPVVLSKIAAPMTTETATTQESAQLSESLLLEQFYALMMARLGAVAGPAATLSTDTIANDAAISPINTVGQQVEKLWPHLGEQQRLIQLLSATYGVTDSRSEQLITTAQPLAFAELVRLAQAEQSSLAEYLDQHMPMIRTYIVPTAADLIIPSAPSQEVHVPARVGEELRDETIADMPSVPLTPEEHQQGSNVSGLKRTDKSRLWLLLLPAALILGAAAWWGVSEYQSAHKAPVLTPPPDLKATEPKVDTKAATAIAPSLTLKMDVAQTIYDCQGAVANAEQKSTLLAALTTALGEQAAQCQITIDPAIDAATPLLPELTNIVSMLAPISFATMHLQGNTLRLSAPDAMALQQLAASVQAAVPNLKVEVAAPPPIPVNNTADPAIVDGQMPTGDNGAAEYDNAANAAPSSNAVSSSIDPSLNAERGNYGTAALPPADTGSPIAPTPAQSAPPAGPISESELDNMLNTVIVAEPAQGGTPLQNPSNP